MTGPQNPEINITRSVTCSNWRAVIIAKLPTNILITLASSNIRFWLLILKIGCIKSFINVIDVIFKSESAVDITAANNPITTNPRTPVGMM